MAKYRTDIRLPENIRDVLERITEVAYPGKIDPVDGTVQVTFETDDEYELATIVKGLESTLNGTGAYQYGLVTIDRPIKL